MWILVFLLLLLQGGALPNGSSPCPNATKTPIEQPTLIVQVVDPDWLRVSGAEVVVKPTDRKTPSATVVTEADGNMRFPVPGRDGGAEYTIVRKGRMA
jgi:hypothetical protein